MPKDKNLSEIKIEDQKIIENKELNLLESLIPVVILMGLLAYNIFFVEGQEWFGDGKDKWPWLDHTPQNYGWHESKDAPEQISVAIAEHPMSNIGRSFHDGKEPEVKQSGKGLYFEEQWKRAMEVDPEFVFVTGWNEWVAMRFDDGRSSNFLEKVMLLLLLFKYHLFFSIHWFSC